MNESMNSITRIAPLEAPYPEGVEEALNRWMGRRPAGIPPLNIFRTMYRNPSMAEALYPLGHYILAAGKLEKAHREILILRTCARCGAQYEWGVHAAVYPARVGLTAEQAKRTYTLAPGAEAESFDEYGALLIRVADELHDDSEISDATWAMLERLWSEEQRMEMMLVCGFYHFISFFARSARVGLEPWQMKFPEVAKA